MYRRNSSYVCYSGGVINICVFSALAAQQISQKKLKKFEKEYHTIREQQEQQEAPIERYEVDMGTEYSIQKEK